jgi:hypothetical protein
MDRDHTTSDSEGGQSSPDANATSAGAGEGDEVPPRIAISEDWAATIVGLCLLVLALLGVIGKGVIP